MDWETFGQNYRFIKELGSGGWGTVVHYEAKRVPQSAGEYEFNEYQSYTTKLFWKTIGFFLCFFSWQRVLFLMSWLPEGFPSR